MTPDEGRALWQAVLDEALEGNEIASRVLHHLIEGFMVDMINMSMRRDSFALTTGQRIETLTEALQEDTQ